MESTFKAPNIVCDGCAETIKKAVGSVAGVSDVRVEVPSKTVVVTHDGQTQREQLRGAMAEAGYPEGMTGAGHHAPSTLPGLVVLTPELKHTPSAEGPK